MIAYAAFGIVLLFVAGWILIMLMAAGQAERRAEALEAEAREREDRRGQWRSELMEAHDRVEGERRRLRGLVEISRSTRERQ